MLNITNHQGNANPNHNKRDVPGGPVAKTPHSRDSPGGAAVKNPPGASLVAQWLRICLPMQGHGFEPWSGKIPHAAERLGP